MSEGNRKEKWGKPKLIVLVRGTPEEGVLEACKVSGLSGPGPGEYQCDYDCGAGCEEVSGS